jgi:hypothetical protein
MWKVFSQGHILSTAGDALMPLSNTKTTFEKFFTWRIRPQGGKQSQNKGPGPGQEVAESPPPPPHVPKHHTKIIIISNIHRSQGGRRERHLTWSAMPYRQGITLCNSLVDEGCTGMVGNNKTNTNKLPMSIWLHWPTLCRDISQNRTIAGEVITIVDWICGFIWISICTLAGYA